MAKAVAVPGGVQRGDTQNVITNMKISDRVDRNGAPSACSKITVARIFF